MSRFLRQGRRARRHLWCGWCLWFLCALTSAQSMAAPKAASRPASLPTSSKDFVHVTKAATRPASRPMKRRRRLVPTYDKNFPLLYAQTMGFRAGTPRRIKISHDGQYLFFLRAKARSFAQDLYLYDVKAKRERILFSVTKLLSGKAEKLSEMMRAMRERRRARARGITNYQLSRDGKWMLITLSGRLFVCDWRSGQVEKLAGTSPTPINPTFSPNARYIAYVSKHDLFVYDRNTHKEKRLTKRKRTTESYGVAEFVAQEEMDRYRGFWWSPDSKQLLVQYTDRKKMDRLRIPDPAKPFQKPAVMAYPRAGRKNAVVWLGLVSIKAPKVRWINFDYTLYPYLATVRWTKHAPLTLLFQNRPQTEQRLVTVDPKTRQWKTLLTERDMLWLNLDQSVPHWLSKGQGFLWSSEHRGRFQLELRGRSGALIQVLTPKDVGYRKLLAVDEKVGVAFIEGGADATQRHLYRVYLNPSRGKPKLLTQRIGLHSGVFQPKAQRWVHRATLAHGLGKTSLKDYQGKVLGQIKSVAALPPFLPNLKWMVVGARSWNVVVIKPRHFEPSARYPVLVHAYGGPFAKMVQMSWRSYLLDQWYADHGFIVVRIDGRGTPDRGRDWERAIKDDFATVALDDQMAALLELSKHIPQMAMKRVGIFGWSFGGYLAAMATIRAPHIFKAGVAGAPVTDWQDYDTHYTERYLGHPFFNPRAYQQSSVITYADQLQRPLLLIHGTADDNVIFKHSLSLSNKLTRAGIAHEFLPLSGATHMIVEPRMVLRVKERTIGFFTKWLKPPQVKRIVWELVPRTHKRVTR